MKAYIDIWLHLMKGDTNLTKGEASQLHSDSE